MSYSAKGRLEEKHGQLAEMGLSLSDISDTPPKPRHFTVADPDGMRIEFTE